MPVISGGKIIEGAVQRQGNPTAEGAMAGSLQVARASYDFAADGGAVGAVNLFNALTQDVIPANAVIIGGWIDVITPLTSGGAATVRLDLEAAGDLLAAAAVSGAPWSTAGRKAILPVFTADSSLRTTAARNIVATIATAALTAGKFDVYLVYSVVA